MRHVAVRCAVAAACCFDARCALCCSWCTSAQCCAAACPLAPWWWWVGAPVVDSKIGVVVAHALVLDSKFVVDSAVADGIVGNDALVVVVGGGGEVDAAVAVLVARQIGRASCRERV